MSKSKKAKSGPAKSTKVKKPVKKVNKPAVKKSAPKKPKASAPKKVAKPAKPAPKAKVAPKKAAPKKPVKAAKPAPKAKVAPKKAAPAPKAKAVKKPLPPPAKSKPAPAAKVVPAPKAAPAKPARVEKPLAKVAAPAAPAKKAEESPAKQQDKKGSDVLAITNTIPVAEKPVISASRIASISHSITNPIKRPETYSVRAEKEPPGKFEMEFVVHASAEMLYEFLSSPSGLSEWFCDDLNIRNGVYTFIWEETMQQARLLKTVELQLVRFQWVDKTDGSYFEFRIQRDELTNDISLIVTDFADSPGDRESSKLLWQNQIEKLMHVIGSVF